VEKALEALELKKIYRDRAVVDGITLRMVSGEVVGLLGPNGAGKTTTFHMMTGLVAPNAGQVILGGEEITTTPMYLRARKGLSYLPQEASIFRKLTVEQNLLAILETLPLTRIARRERSNQLLEDLSITHIARSKGHMISGGERRRVEIARALVREPSFLLLDEPFAGIDPIAVGTIQEIISKLKKRGIGVLISDHNVRETLSITNRSYIIYQGKILVTGTPDVLVNDQRAREVFLGEKFGM
jgi:lipopolysaccharide export system ATP-binding protein